MGYVIVIIPEELGGTCPLPHTLIPFFSIFEFLRSPVVLLYLEFLTSVRGIAIILDSDITIRSTHLVTF